MHSPIRISLTAAIAALAACATVPPPSPPNVPAALAVPPGQEVFLEAHANGVQIYQCAAKSDGGFDWSFRGPEATLADTAGKTIGKHYAGPTWESTDGSTVVGDLKAKDSGPDPAAVPWLLLSAKSTSGSGVFSKVKSIQRVATAGGQMPAAACTSINIDQTVRVPYSANYYFYRAAS